FAVELGKSLAVPAVVEHRALPGRRRPELEARETIADVRGEAGLRIFAVVDDVDAGLDLTPDDPAHRLAHRLVPPFGLAVAGRQCGEDLRRSDETADVRREDALRTAQHDRDYDTNGPTLSADPR